jgi:MFS family permease
MRSYLRSLNPRLPAEVWTLQAGGLANSFGNGVVLPFLIIYLHNVRDVSLGVAGLVAASNSVCALCSGLGAGSLADRFGPRRTLTASLLVMAVAYGLFPLIHSAWHAVLLNSLAGIGSGAFWPSQSSLLTRLTPPDRRHAAFAQQRVTMNLGMGLGGLVGGAIATTAHPWTFDVLFLVDTATFLVFAAVLTRVPSGRPAADPEQPSASGYSELVHDSAFMRFAALNVLFIVAATFVFELLPPFAKDQAGVSEQGVGAIWFVNAFLIVLIQLPIAKLVEGRRRMRALALMALIWAASLMIVLVGGAWFEGTAAALVFVGAASLFAVGECLHGATQGPIVADLAPPRLVGRYMAVSSLTWQVAFIIGPAAGGFLLQHAPLALWPIGSAICLGAGAWSLALERALPESTRVAPTGIPAASLPAGELVD